MSTLHIKSIPKKDIIDCCVNSMNGLGDNRITLTRADIVAAYNLCADYEVNLRTGRTLDLATGKEVGSQPPYDEKYMDLSVEFHVSVWVAHYAHILNKLAFSIAIVPYLEALDKKNAKYNF